MKKQELLKLSNEELNKAVKIAGTDFDRRRKLTKVQIKDIQKGYKQGKTLTDLAKQYSVSPVTVRYHVDEAFKEANIKASTEYKRSNGWLQNRILDADNRADYKRQLIEDGKIK